MMWLKKSACYTIIFLLLGGFAQAQTQSHSFEIKNNKFYYDNQPILIHSGEMHYARVPEPYWRQRFKMMKAMGLNAVATYVFWNYHNTAPGVWDFTTENRNLAKFIETAGEEGLFVILRPGPYVCAEWEYGGYPWWLLNNKKLVVRTKNQPFLDSCKVYINQLAGQVKNLQVTHGGPIIMVQVENEFGSYVAQRKDISLETHRQYYHTIKQFLTDAGFDVPFYTSDGSWLFNYGAIPGVLPTANGEGNIDTLKRRIDKYYPGGPYMVAEYYPGWLDHWAEPFVHVGTNQVTQQIEKYLKNDISFNFYMVHGGTNFGFTSGANYNNEHNIQPDITSYDYDAPISEAGWATPKYLAIRDLMERYVTYPMPEIPDQIPVIKVPDIRLKKTYDFFDWIKAVKPVVDEIPLSFEELGQGYGYVLYTKYFKEPVQGKLKLKGLRDYALVYVNGRKAGELNRLFNNYSLDINIPSNGRLDILVENMGRINYGSEITNNNKGIISPVFIDNLEIRGNWEMFKVPVDKVPAFPKHSRSCKKGLPAFYSAVFDLQETGDVFLDMRGWGKGIVFVNGHNLGRYWKAGPQQTLYLPGCWLKEGKNQVLLFEQQNDAIQKVLKSSEQPILDKLVPVK
ncbi:MAG: beta-galactosidase [Bacteroidota bacterium]|nr:beta-galactosidase [Bacteroidota bacterium]